MRDDSFTVDGGEVTGARRVDGRHDLWRITVEPDGEGDVTVTLPAGRECAVSGAICTRGENRRQLANAPAATVAGPLDEALGPNTAAAGAPTIGGTPQVGEELTASTSGISDADGLDNASFAYQWNRTGVDIGGATASTYTPVAADEGERLKVRVSFTDDAGHEESLTSAGTDAVAGAASTAEPLTARFVQAPYEHDGKTAFELRIGFSEGISIGFRTFRDQSLSVSGGSVKHAKRVDGRRDLWKVTVKPGSLGDVTVTLPGGRACGTAGAVCTGDGRALSATISTTVLGPAALSVADARVREGTDETIDFTVSLSRAASGSVAVDYATSDGTASAGEDYTAASGTLTFAPGETEKAVAVAVLDDAKDEGEETFTLMLSNPSGAVIADGQATGTIENSDPLQQAWLARFGRTVASQVVDAVSNRFSGSGGPSQVTIGDLTINPHGALEEDDPHATWEARFDRKYALLREPETRTMTTEEIILGSSFRLGAGGEDGTPAWGAWGSFSTGSFEADVDEVALQGDVTTGLLGVDVSRDTWLAGLAFSSSRGDGPFKLMSEAPTNRSVGWVESTLTALYPYARFELTDRVEAWGIAGTGTGALTIKEDGGSPIETDLRMKMGAIGTRSTLLDAGSEGGLDLALKSDALWVRMTSDEVDGDDGRLAAAQADVTRVRLVLGGSQTFEMTQGRTLTPSLEVGMRHDGGDAETGMGLELGGGVQYAGPGFTVEGAVRTLVAHEESGYKEWGASGSIRIDPGASGRGLSFTLAPTWGAASSGIEQLWGLQHPRGLAEDREFDATGRIEAELGYGLGMHSTRGVVTPYAGLSLAEGGNRTYRAGARWNIAPGAALGLEGTRHESAAEEPATSAIVLRAQLRW